MSAQVDRRQFVRKSLGAGALAGLGDLVFLKGLPQVNAADTKVPGELVQFTPEIEPLVRLIEDTPRSKLLETVAARVRAGTSYQQVLTALFLAGVRGIQPRPVGFKFHAVLVVNSAHMAAQAASDKDRWLPLFWALDNFKASQKRNEEEGGWHMRPAQGKLPSAEQAKNQFIEAMDRWDEEAADRAIAALARTAGASEVAELFWRYGARDFRDIGHKAIFAANSWRTLQAIGLRHAEPVWRSLAYAMLEHEEGNPAQRDAEADRPGRENLLRCRQINASWQEGRAAPEATRELVKTLRTASYAEAGDFVVALLNKHIHPQSLWDGLFLRAGESLMQQPGIVGVHCVTSVNALHYAYQASGRDETRRLLLLQAAAFLALFRKRLATGSSRTHLEVDTLEDSTPRARGADAVAEILADISKDRVLAARKMLGLLKSEPEQAETLMAAARRLIFTKGTDSHDYKFSSAALEDFYNTSPDWRNRYLATSVFFLHGSADSDNQLIKRAREELVPF